MMSITGADPVYCYLQINLHTFRTLLLLPFVVSLLLFNFSLRHHHYDNSCYDQNDPRHYSIKSYLVQTEQVAKAKQTGGSTTPNSPSADSILFKRFIRVTEPHRLMVGHIYLMSTTATSYKPPPLFPNRASPA